MTMSNNGRRREPLSTILAGQPLSAQVAGACGAVYGSEDRARGEPDRTSNKKSTDRIDLAWSIGRPPRASLRLPGRGRIRGPHHTLGGSMSTALVAGLIGLFGTVLGTALTTWTTRQTAARSDRQAWLETRRQEFLSAVRQFASALLAYRLAVADHWGASHGGKASATTEQEVHRLRKAGLDGLCLLALSSDDDRLLELAEDALDEAYKIGEAGTQDESMTACAAKSAKKPALTSSRSSSPASTRTSPGESSRSSSGARSQAGSWPPTKRQPPSSGPATHMSAAS